MTEEAATTLEEESAPHEVAGQQLRTIRESEGLTREHVVRMTGIGRGTLAQIELGQQAPSERDWALLYKAFGDIPTFDLDGIEVLKELAEENIELNSPELSKDVVRLKTVRNFLGHSRNDVEEATGIRAMVLRDYECGMRDPTAEHVAALSDFYTVDIPDFGHDV